MASCYFVIHMNVNELKLKNPFDAILNLSFDLKPLKMNTYCQICKGLSKGFI
jgi:hypothetical protein